MRTEPIPAPPTVYRTFPLRFVYFRARVKSKHSRSRAGPSIIQPSNGSAAAFNGLFMYPLLMRLRVGQQISIAWLQHVDGTCQFCRRERKNLCRDSRYTYDAILGRLCRADSSRLQSMFHLPTIAVLYLPQSFNRALTRMKLLAGSAFAQRTFAGKSISPPIALRIERAFCTG